MPNKSEEQPSLAALIIGVLFLLGGLLFIIGSWGAYITDTKIQEGGSSADAHIEKKVFLSDAEGVSDYILEYWFTTENGSKINATRNVSKTLWKSVSEGQTIGIKYSSSNPKRNFPNGEGVTSLGISIFASVFGALFTILGGALIWGYFRKA